MSTFDVNRLDHASVQDKSAGRLSRAIQIARREGVFGLIALARRHGVVGSLNFVFKNLRHLAAHRLAMRWDRKHDVDTAGSIQLDSLTVVGPNRALGNECVCTSPKSFDFIMRSLPKALEDFTFIDIGAGKSRTLLLASAYPFQRIVGVEFARELVEVASRNIARFRSANRRCDQLSIIEADAADFQFPDTPLVVYFYNPFSAELFSTVMANITASLKQAKRDCFIIYGSSSHGAINWARPAIEETGMFEQLPAPRMPMFLDAVRTIEYAVYRARS